MLQFTVVDISPLTLILKADEFHVYNILFNLVDNAVKYSGLSPKIEIIVTDGKHETRLSFSIEIASSWWGISENLGAGKWRRNWFR